jgi:hypothetical protein
MSKTFAAMAKVLLIRFHPVLPGSSNKVRRPRWTRLSSAFSGDANRT